MDTDSLRLQTISQQRFFELWESKKSEVVDDDNRIYQFFKPYMDTIPRLALGEYYWQIFNNARPFPKILIAEGAVSKLTPVDGQGLVDASVEEFFSFYHPDDLKQAMTFISLIFQVLFEAKPEERKNFNITVYIRIKNKEGKYVWNSLQYPALYFDENDTLLYGMALYTNVQHLMKPDAVPMMTVLDSSQPDNQVFTYYSSQGQKGVEKPYPSTSQREKEIIALLSQGKASKQIADILGITKNTVDNHRQRLLKKFGVRSSAELVIRALNF